MSEQSHAARIAAQKRIAERELEQEEEEETDD